MKHQPLITESRVEAFTASALRFVCWLFGVIVRFGLTGKSHKLCELLRHAERAVECTLFLRAVARFGPAPKQRMHRPASAPPGFRVVRATLTLFYKRANIRARKASVIERVLALIDALQKPERAILYFLKRILKGLRGRRLVIAAPGADAFFSALAPCPQCSLDSS